jgi:hypothetical protein
MVYKCRCGNEAEYFTDWGEMLCNECMENKCSKCPIVCEHFCFKSIRAVEDAYYFVKEDLEAQLI